MGLQEIIALGLVLAVVGFAIYRRLRRSREKRPACADPTESQEPDEQTIRFYRRRKD